MGHHPQRAVEFLQEVGVGDAAVQPQQNEQPDGQRSGQKTHPQRVLATVAKRVVDPLGLQFARERFDHKIVRLVLKNGCAFDDGTHIQTLRNSREKMAHTFFFGSPEGFTLRFFCLSSWYWG
jgi:hypothetical protein